MPALMIACVLGCARAPAPVTAVGTAAGAPAPTTSEATTRPRTSGAAQPAGQPVQVRHRAIADLLPEQRAPQVTVDFSAQAASVAQASRDGQLARLSPQARPTPFDLSAYVRDPLAYLNVIEPCRIWQQAEPGPGVDALVTVDGAQAALVTVAPGATQPLRVITWPGHAATFTSMDRGAFQNGLTSITVQADADGVATAQFTATPGTTDQVRIAAASPVVCGQVSFTVVIP